MNTDQVKRRSREYLATLAADSRTQDYIVSHIRDARYRPEYVQAHERLAYTLRQALEFAKAADLLIQGLP